MVGNKIFTTGTVQLRRELKIGRSVHACAATCLASYSGGVCAAFSAQQV